MKIRDIRATTVSVPLEAPLRHANGCHWGRFVRTIVEVETDNGLIGLGEMGGGGETAEAAFRAMKSYLVGHDPARIEEMRFLITHKLKGGVFHPDYELEAYRALAAAFPGDSLRFDPNAVWSTEQAVRFGQAIEGLRNDYLEDPVFGLNGMRRTRQMVRIPLATNTVVVNFEQLAANVLDTAVDVILLDTTFWGGIRACVKAAGVCETFQLGIAVHSSGELGIQLATMLHLGAVLPNLAFAADAHYHHLTDDIIEGGLMQYQDGAIRVPQGPGLGVKLDRDKLRRYREHYQRLGGYPYDQDPARPGWTPIIPNDRWANPNDDRAAAIPY
jgi:glucarate dehydratase